MFLKNKLNLKVLAIVRKKDTYSKNLLNYLKKNVTNILVLYSEDSKSYLFKKKINKWKGDYIFSFRSKFILKKNILKKAKKMSINFHPGPPEYRGIGCANFAILNDEKVFGVTAHIINNKIDNGKILKVIYFKFNKSWNLKLLLKKTHQSLLELAIEIIDKIFKKKIFKSNYRWSKKLYNLKQLNELYNLNKSLKKYNLDKILKATLIDNFKPFLITNKKKIYIN